MHRTAAAAFLLALLPSQGAGQDASGDPVDFVLRPTQDSGSFGGEQDLWSFAAEEAPVITGSIDPVIGPPMAGPEADDPIGPPMAGPDLPPRPELLARRVARGESTDDPFAPIGFRAGPFILRPAIELGIAATDNAEGGSDGDPATGFIVAPEIRVTAEEGKYSLDAEARGEALIYGDDEIDERDAEARLALAYELTRSTRLEAEAEYSYTLDSYTDPDTPDDAVERPPVHEYGASLAATQRLGRVAFTMRGTVEREAYEDVALAGGGTASRDELDNTAGSVAFRAAYEAGALTPFVEAEIGRRDFDLEMDSDGFRRSSQWTALTGGVVVDLGPKLSGEVSAGYHREELDDPALDDIDGLEVNAALLWSPRRLTTVRLDLSTSVDPTTIAGASGSLVYSGELSVERRMRSGLGMEAGLGIEYETFTGISRDETTYSAFAGVSYALNRRVALAARVTHEAVDSSETGEDSDENRVEVRLRLQH